MSPWPGLRDPSQRAYQRRNPRPMLAVCGLLLAIVVLTWSVVFGNTTKGPSGSVCPVPSAAGWNSGAVQPPDALGQVAPAPPSIVRIQVLNGSSQRGQANLVASQLGELGFTEAGDPMNDPFYPAGNLSCRGEVRYGPNGMAAARTVRLVLPCVALVRDTRTDDTVDIAVGTLFGEVNPSKAARTALQQLGGQTSMGDVGSPAAPSVDPDLLKQAGEVPC
jgi:LytR cell envelope-related transcriptional attenuator